MNFLKALRHNSLVLEAQSGSQSMAKKFSEIDGLKQYEIMVALLQRFADSGAPMLEELSDREGRPSQAIWDDICRASGIAPCGVPDFLLMKRQTAPGRDRAEQ